MVAYQAMTASWVLMLYKEMIDQQLIAGEDLRPHDRCRGVAMY